LHCIDKYLLIECASNYIIISTGDVWGKKQLQRNSNTCKLNDTQNTLSAANDGQAGETK